MLTGLDHVMIGVPDLTRAIDAYTRIGFRVHPGGIHAGMGTRAVSPSASSGPRDPTGREERVMTEERAPSKAELMEALRTSRDLVIATVRGLTPERLEEGRYEGGWNGRQILAHLASIEWTYPRLIDIARSAPAAEAAAGDEPPTRTMRGGNDAYNERQVARRAHVSAAELLVEFEQNRAATIRAVEATDEALLGRRIRSAGGVAGELALVLRRVAVDHVVGHARDIAGRG